MSVDRIRSEVDQMMTAKLEELTPQIVKRVRFVVVLFLSEDEEKTKKKNKGENLRHLRQEQVDDTEIVDDTAA